MNRSSALLLLAVAGAAIAIVLLKPGPGSSSTTTPSASSAAITSSSTASAPRALPRLLDLGAKQCVPCKLMAPILDELRLTYAGVLQVDFIDVWDNRAAATAHHIASIPTQIFFAPDGRELFRHEGFLAREDVLARWKSLGFDLQPASPATPAP